VWFRPWNPSYPEGSVGSKGRFHRRALHVQRQRRHSELTIPLSLSNQRFQSTPLREDAYLFTKRSGSFLNEPDRERDVSAWIGRTTSAQPGISDVRLPYQSRHTAPSLIEEQTIHKTTDRLCPVPSEVYIEHFSSITSSVPMIASRALCCTRIVHGGTITNVGRRLISTHPVSIKPSRDELSTGRLNSRNLEKAVRSLHEDGLVVIEDAIPHEDLDRLNEKMVQDALLLQSRGKDMPFNYNVGNSIHPYHLYHAQQRQC
jgi:hypothetical protein